MIGTIVAYFLGGAFVVAPIALGIWVDRRSGRVVWSGWRAEFAEIGSAVSELASGLLQLAGGLIALAILGILAIIGLSAFGWLASLSIPVLLVGVVLLLFLILLALIANLSKN